MVPADCVSSPQSIWALIWLDDTDGPSAWMFPTVNEAEAFW